MCLGCRWSPDFGSPCARAGGGRSCALLGSCSTGAPPQRWRCLGSTGPARGRIPLRHRHGEGDEDDEDKENDDENDEDEDDENGKDDDIDEYDDADDADDADDFDGEDSDEYYAADQDEGIDDVSVMRRSFLSVQN